MTDLQESERVPGSPLGASLPEVKALLNVEVAARELDALFDGEPAAWTLAGHVCDPEVAHALLSLHDYLNDVENARG